MKMCQGKDVEHGFQHVSGLRFHSVNSVIWILGKKWQQIYIYKRMIFYIFFVDFFY